jgi:transcriptional regulator with XRE-family HTH domain
MKDSTSDPAAAANATTTTIVSWRDFGPFLQRLRRRRGISQETLAERLACHRTHIWRLEHGRHHPSRMFLRSLKLVCEPLTGEETTALRVFDQLREYRMDEAETA